MTLTPAMLEIQPCPFCGTRDQFVERYDYSACFVQCDGNARDGMTCGVRGPIGVQDSDDEDMPGQAAAIRAWNARAQAQRAVGVDIANEAKEIIRRARLMHDESQQELACLMPHDWEALLALIERAGGGA